MRRRAERTGAPAFQGSVHIPRSRITEESRQAVLDAAALLQVTRSELGARLARGEPCEAEVVARTISGAQLWIYDEVADRSELLTVRPAARRARCGRSSPATVS